MADIFLSYSSTDRDRVAPVAQALEDRGWTVWWDRQIPPGRTYAEVIADALKAAEVVVCAWTQMSVKSYWVLTEAEEGRARDRLVPVSLEKIEIPIEFRRIQSADLIGWSPGTDHDGFNELIGALDALIGPGASSEPMSERIGVEADHPAEQRSTTHATADHNSEVALDTGSPAESRVDSRVDEIAPAKAFVNWQLGQTDGMFGWFTTEPSLESFQPIAQELSRLGLSLATNIYPDDRCYLNVAALPDGRIQIKIVPNGEAARKGREAKVVWEEGDDYKVFLMKLGNAWLTTGVYPGHDVFQEYDLAEEIAKPYRERIEKVHRGETE